MFIHQLKSFCFVLRFAIFSASLYTAVIAINAQSFLIKKFWQWSNEPFQNFLCLLKFFFFFASEHFWKADKIFRLKIKKSFEVFSRSIALLLMNLELNYYIKPYKQQVFFLRVVRLICISVNFICSFANDCHTVVRMIWK